MGQVGRQHSESSGPMSLLKKGHPRAHLHRTVYRKFLNISSEGDPKTSPGNLFHSHLHSKEVVIILRWNFLCSSFSLLPFVLLLNTMLPGSILLVPSLRYLHISIISPISHLLWAKKHQLLQSFLTRWDAPVP